MRQTLPHNDWLACAVLPLDKRTARTVKEFNEPLAKPYLPMANLKYEPMKENYCQEIKTTTKLDRELWEDLDIPSFLRREKVADVLMSIPHP